MSNDEEYDGIEGFCECLGTTMRECIDCGCMTPGGPTRCKRCAREYQEYTKDYTKDIVLDSPCTPTVTLEVTPEVVRAIEGWKGLSGWYQRRCLDVLLETCGGKDGIGWLFRIGQALSKGDEEK